MIANVFFVFIVYYTLLPVKIETRIPVLSQSTSFVLDVWYLKSVRVSEYMITVEIKAKFSDLWAGLFCISYTTLIVV